MSLLTKLKQSAQNRHFLSLASQVSLMAINFLSFALVTRLVSKEIFGSWQVFLLAFGVLEAVRMFVVYVALVKYLSGAEPQQARQVAGAGWLIMLGMNAIIFAVTLPLALLNITDSMGWQLVLQWCGLGLLLTLPSNYASWLLVVDQRFDRIFIVRAVSVVGYVLMVLWFNYLNRLSVEALVYAYLVSQGLSSLMCLFNGWAKPGTLLQVTKAGVWQILNFGKFSVWSGVGSLLLKSADGFIIEWWLGPAALAMYQVPSKVMEVMEIPLRSAVNTAMPSMSAHANQGQKAAIAQEMTKYGGIVTVAMLPAVLACVVLADVLVWIMGGDQYLGTEATTILRLLIVFYVLLPLDRFLGITLDAVGRPALNMVKTLVMLAVQVGGDFLGLYWFGNTVAVAVVSLLTLGVGTALGHWFLKKHLTYTLSRFFTDGWTFCRQFLQQVLTFKPKQL
jgi:O-antigen/teichoic acid export membrane protein